MTNDEKVLGTNTIKVMESLLKNVDSLYEFRTSNNVVSKLHTGDDNSVEPEYRKHVEDYENEVLRIIIFITSYFALRIFEHKQKSYDILVFLTPKNTICIGHPAYPAMEISYFYSKKDQVHEFEEALEEVMHFLDVSKNFQVYESLKEYELALKAYTITYCPDSES